MTVASAYITDCSGGPGPCVPGQATKVPENRKLLQFTYALPPPPPDRAVLNAMTMHGQLRGLIYGEPTPPPYVADPTRYAVPLKIHSDYFVQPNLTDNVHKAVQASSTAEVTLTPGTVAFVTHGQRVCG